MARFRTSIKRLMGSYLKHSNHNSPNPFGTSIIKFQNLRTIIVIADIDEGLQ